MVNKKEVSIALRFAVSFGLLLFLIWKMRGDIKGILDTLKNLDKIFFILAVSINMPLTLALAYRLKILMFGQKVMLRIKDAIYLTFIGYFFNNFLPTAIGGDIAKAYYASKKTDNKVGSYIAVIADRVFGFTATILIACIGFIFMWKDLKNNALIWLIPLAFVLLMVAAFFLITIFKDRISKLYIAIKLYRHNPGLLIKTFLISLSLQGLAIVSTYFFILCVGGYIDLIRLFLIIPAVWTLSMVPSLGGLGVRENAFVYFLTGYIGKEKAASVSILWLSMVILYSIIGGVFHLLYPKKAAVPVETGML